MGVEPLTSVVHVDLVGSAGLASAAPVTAANQLLDVVVLLLFAVEVRVALLRLHANPVHCLPLHHCRLSALSLSCVSVGDLRVNSRNLLSLWPLVLMHQLRELFESLVQATEGVV